MSAPLRSYRVALDDAGACAVWVTAQSRQVACQLAESMLTEKRSLSGPGVVSITRVEILDEYEDDVAA
jgi:hypothetical protein